MYYNLLQKFIIDSICGNIAGFMITITGFPFDTIKVRMQNGQTHLIKSVLSLLKQEGFLAFFKGIYYPLITNPLANAVVFGSYQLYKNLFPSQIGFKQGLLSGSFAGFVSSFITGPIQLIKCRMQIQKNNIKYTSSFDCMIKIYRNQGIRKGVFKGTLATIFRQVPAYGAQFATYQFLKKCLQIDDNIIFSKIFFCGSLAGLSCWVFSYPQDVIKTRLQLCDGQYKIRFKDGGLIQCGLSIYREKGLRGYWKGFLACSMRASSANGIGLLTYDLVRHKVRSLY